MKPRICICCGERMTRVAKASPINPHVCGACYVIVLGNGEAIIAGKSKSSAPKANTNAILPIFPAAPDYSFS